MDEIEITITEKITTENINDLVSTALEGGINYWCGVAKMKRNADKTFFGVAVEDQDKIEYASDLIGYGGVLVICDAESSDHWELNKENMLKGIRMYCINNNISVADMLDSYDAETADSIVQYALFNEIVFG